MYSLLQRFDGSTVVSIRFQSKPLVSELVIRRHLGDSQGGQLHQPMSVMVEEPREKAQVSREAIHAIR